MDDISVRIEKLTSERREHIEDLPRLLADLDLFDTLRKLLITLPFLSLKLEQAGAQLLIDDFDLALSHPTAENGIKHDGLLLVRRAIAAAQHILDPDCLQLSAQLLGRLRRDDGDEIDYLLNQARQPRDPPQMRPVSATLPSPTSIHERTLSGHGYSVTAVTTANTVHGECLVWASWDKTIRVAQLRTGHELKTLVGHAQVVTCIAATHDGHFIVSGSEDDTICVWNVRNFQLVKRIDAAQGGVLSLALSVDGRFVFSGSGSYRDIPPEAPTIKMWDLETGTCTMTLIEHTDCINGLACSNDGTTLVSASYDGRVVSWDTLTGDRLQSLDLHSGRIRSFTLAKDGLGYAATERGCVVELSTDDLFPMNTWELWLLPATAIAVSPDGSAVAAGSVEGDVFVSFPDRRPIRIKAHSEDVNSLAFTTDGGRLVSGSSDRTISVWDLQQGTTVSEFHDDVVNVIAFTTDGKFAISASGSRHTPRNPSIRVWDAQTGAVTKTLTGHSQGIHSVTALHDSSQILSYDYWANGVVWDLETQEQFEEVTSFIKLDEPSIQLPTNFGWELSLGADGAVDLIAGSSKSVDGMSGTCLRLQEPYSGIRDDQRLPGLSRRIKATAISSDGRYAAAGSEDGYLTVWDLSTTQVVFQATAHDNLINAVDIAKNGDFVVSAGADSTVVLWDLHLGTAVSRFTGDKSMTACSISPDMNTIAAGEEGGRVHLLHIGNN